MLGTALVLVRLAVPTGSQHSGSWLDDRWRKNAVVVAIYLVPFAGLAFLWFVGVIRDRIGLDEDRLFATVFLGTGLLFVAMLFVTAAVAGGLIAAEARGAAKLSPEVWRFGQHTTHLVLTVFAMRMAGVFTLVTTTIALRLGIVPRWLVMLGVLVAVVLLLTVESVPWVELLFPLWVLMLSLYFLFNPQADRAPETAEPLGIGLRPPPT